MTTKTEEDGPEWVNSRVFIETATKWHDDYAAKLQSDISDEMRSMREKGSLATPALLALLALERVMIRRSLASNSET